MQHTIFHNMRIITPLRKMIFCLAIHHYGAQLFYKKFQMQASNSKKKEAIKHKLEAIKWLQEDSDEFESVCLLANLSLDYVKAKATEALKNG